MNSCTILGYIHREPTQMGENGCYGIIKSSSGKKNKEGKLTYIWFLFQAYGETAKYCMRYITKGDEVLLSGKIMPSFKDEKEKVLEVKEAKKISTREERFGEEPVRRTEQTLEEDFEGEDTPITDQRPVINIGTHQPRNTTIINIDEAFDDLPF